jgi:ribosomal protein S18 acetylase RimI-like enzyme
MSLNFRPASVEDADAAVPLIYASGPEQFDYVFCVNDAGQALRFLHAAFVSGRGRFGWPNYTIACVDDRVVGIGTAQGAEANLRFFFEDGWLILRHYGLRAFGVMFRGLRAERILLPPTRGEWMIAHLAMAPTERGQGIGARMVNYLLDRGARAGKATAVLDVSIENTRAEALYQRLGFKLVIERPSTMKSAYGRFMNHRRMMLRI